MNDSQRKRRIYIISFLSLSFAGMIGFGHACSQYVADGSGVLSLSSDAENIIFGEKTASTVYSKQIVDNFQSCLGVTNLSNNTIATWNRVRASISETGSAGELNAPMMMAVASIAGEVCRDLISQENAINIDQRKFFRGISLNARASNIGEAELSGAINSIARACWQRDESAQEATEVRSALREAFTDSSNTVDVMLFACTGMLSSTDSFTF